MSNKRYLEIDSSHRNRQSYPEPADFEVFISQSGTKGRFRALDPVSQAAPLEVWSPATLIATVGSGQANTNNTLSEFVGRFVIDAMEKENGYYNGMPIDIDPNGPPVAENTRITEWSYLSSDAGFDYFTINVSPSLTFIVDGPSDKITFRDSTDFTAGRIWIPNSPGINHYYVGKIIYNQTRNEYREIISFDEKNRLAGIDISTPVPTWLETDTLIIRSVAPDEVGSLVGGSGNNVILPATSSAESNYYVGSFLRITGLTPVFMSRITSYTGLGSAGPPVVPDRQLTLSSRLPSTLVGGETYEILQFTRDNAVPFTYTGSLVSQQQMVCYEISLVRLILPNQILTTGSRIAFYPYVYVQLQNVSGSSSRIRHAIYSNNPTSTKMLFRVPIGDVHQPIRSLFVRVSSDMTQTVKFKPNDNFRFAVYLPDGTLFQTITPESESPEPANILKQISAVFSIKKL